MQREALKYGTVPEYKSWLPEGFDKWVYKKTGKDVGKLKAITGNTYYKAVCHEVHHSPSVSEPTPAPTPIPNPTPTPGDVNYLYIKNYGSASSCFQLNVEGDPTIYENLEFQYSYDKTDWIDVVFDTDIEVPVGETVFLKAKTSNDHFYRYPESGSSGGVYITDYYASSWADTNFEVGGSVMSLLDSTDTLRDLTGKPGCFYYLFYKFQNLVKADNLVFPATTLSYYCYGEAFDYCYYLQSINPNLLPASDLTNGIECYYYMFYDCTALENAPNLPATTLSEGCYDYMFCDCSSLEIAPLLPATDLEDDCYYGMFYDCSSLNSIEVRFNSFDSLPSFATDYWLYGVNSSGTFKWPGATTGVTQDSSHIPSGWTITN